MVIEAVDGDDDVKEGAVKVEKEEEKGMDEYARCDKSGEKGAAGANDDDDGNLPPLPEKVKKEKICVYFWLECFCIVM